MQGPSARGGGDLRWELKERIMILEFAFILGVVGLSRDRRGHAWYAGAWRQKLSNHKPVSWQLFRSLV